MHQEVLKDKLFQIEMTVSELARIYEQPLPNCNQKHAQQCEPNSYDKSWYGGIGSLREAKMILENGWPEGAARAEQLKNSLEVDLPRVHARKRKQAWLSEGDSLDVDRALAGNWDYAYRGSVREPAPGSRFVTLNCGWGGNCFQTAEQLFWSGAVMIALSDVIEDTGMRVRINAIHKNRAFGFYSRGSGGDNYSLYTVVVKDHGEPLRVDAVAGIVCHAGIFRTYGFRVICNAPWDVGSGLGSSVGWEDMDQIRKEVNHQWEPGTITVKDCYSREDAIQEVKRILKIVHPNAVEQ